MAGFLLDRGLPGTGVGKVGARGYLEGFVQQWRCLLLLVLNGHLLPKLPLLFKEEEAFLGPEGVGDGLVHVSGDFLPHLTLFMFLSRGEVKITKAPILLNLLACMLHTPHLMREYFFIGGGVSADARGVLAPELLLVLARDHCLG